MRSAISLKLQSNFNEIALRHGWSPVNVLHIFKTPFLQNTSAWLLLNIFIENVLLDPCKSVKTKKGKTDIRRAN